MWRRRRYRIADRHCPLGCTFSPPTLLFSLFTLLFLCSPAGSAEKNIPPFFRGYACCMGRRWRSRRPNGWDRQKQGSQRAVKIGNGCWQPGTAADC